MLKYLLLIFLTLNLVVYAVPSTAFAEFDGGDGTAEDPYLVRTPEQLNNIRNHMEQHFLQIADIDLLELGNWEPIGEVFAPGHPENKFFSGKFQGNGYIIKNLTIDSPNTDFAGLFAGIQLAEIDDITSMEEFLEFAQLTEANIQNVILENVNVSGNGFAGSLVGLNELGSISKSSASGVVSGKTMPIGGLVGYNHGIIAQSFSTGEINGKIAGGLIGVNSVYIMDSYAFSRVAEIGFDGVVASLVGINEGVVERCYAVGSVVGTSQEGGLVGLNQGRVVNSYYDMKTTGQDDTDRGAPKRTEEMMQEATYDLWDFLETWAIQVGVGYPYLQWQNSPPEYSIDLNKEELQAIAEALQQEDELREMLSLNLPGRWERSGFTYMEFLIEPDTSKDTVIDRIHIIVEALGGELQTMFLYQPNGERIIGCYTTLLEPEIIIIHEIMEEFADLLRVDIAGPMAVTLPDTPDLNWFEVRSESTLYRVGMEIICEDAVITNDITEAILHRAELLGIAISLQRLGARRLVMHIFADDLECWEVLIRRGRLSLRDKDGEVLITEKAVASAEAGFHPELGQPIVKVSLTDEGTTRFEEITTELTGERISIDFDYEQLMILTIDQPIKDGRGYIGGFTDIGEAEEFAFLLHAGALPFPLEVVESGSIMVIAEMIGYKTSVK